MAKALALGAEMCGAALPFLKSLLLSKKAGLTALLGEWRKELLAVLFLTGSKTPAELMRPGILTKKNK
jgi:isopentenyl diphosphate isomerase/L-lactate dehydrogenase-like FMN-dependent dehydrogenase